MRVVARAVTLLAVAAADTCSLFEIADGTCGQSDLNCDYVKYAKAAEKGLQDGTCAAQGYTVKGDTETKTYPVIGDIVITKYTKPTLAVADTCSLYAVDGKGTCGQSDLNCDYVKYAKAAEKSLQDGTCAAQGYTVKGDTETKTYPVIGDIVITKYTKPTLAVADTCSLYAVDGKGTCGQSDLNCDYVKYAKAAEKSLQDGTCTAQGYTVKGDTETKTYPVIGDIVITKYTKPSLAVADTCSLYALDGQGTCGQSDLNCDYVKYAKAAEKSLQDGTCAAQGYTVKGSTETKTYPVIGDIVITKYTKPSLAVTDTCSLYAVDGKGTCGQSDLNCDYVKYAKAAEKSLQDGTCAAQGYTVKGSTETKTYPVIGDIVITKYTKPSLAATDTCSLYAVDGKGTCGQSDLNCDYVKYAKAAEKSLQDGTCAAQGYTVKGSTETKTYPVIGDIVITKYTKPSLAEAWV